MQIESHQSKRIMLKAVVLGFDPALQAGFLNMASGSNISHQLYNAVGVSIGVMNIQQREKHISLQMWSLPLREKLHGLTQSFMRGHHIAIILLRPDEVRDIRSLLQQVGLTDHEKLLYVIIGEEPNASLAASELKSIIGEGSDFGNKPSVIDTILSTINHFMPFHANNDKIAITRIRPAVCSPFVAPTAQEKFPPNTYEEIEQILVAARNLELATSEDEKKVTFPFQLGNVELDIATGSAIFYPMVCHLCRYECKRKIRLCIVTADTGWTNTGLSPGALFTIAKLHAFATGEIPQDIMMQMLRAVQCTKFTPNEEIDQNLKMQIMPPPSQIEKRESLMQIALRRLRNGRLNRETFELLKKRLTEAQER